MVVSVPQKRGPRGIIRKKKGRELIRRKETSPPPWWFVRTKSMRLKGSSRAREKNTTKKGRKKSLQRGNRPGGGVTSYTGGMMRPTLPNLQNKIIEGGVTKGKSVSDSLSHLTPDSSLC